MVDTGGVELTEDSDLLGLLILDPVPLLLWRVFQVIQLQHEFRIVAIDRDEITLPNSVSSTPSQRTILRWSIDRSPDIDYSASVVASKVLAGLFFVQVPSDAAYTRVHSLIWEPS